MRLPLSRRPADPAPPVPAPPADPNAAYVFRPAPVADDGQGVVTLDLLFQLSRSP